MQLDEKIVTQEILKSYQEKVSYLRNERNLFLQNLVLVSQLTKVAETRNELIRQVDEVKSFYLVEAILQQFVEDALAPDISTGDVLSLSSPNEEVQKELDYLDSEFKFDNLIEDIIYDLLCYGEYTLSTKVEPEKGLVDLNDDVEQNSVFSYSKRGEIIEYLVLDKSSGRIQLRRVEPYHYVKFVLSGRKIRLDLERELGAFYKQIPKDFPRFIRVGRSLIYSAIPKIKELQLLEILVPSSKLNKVLRGSIVGVNVPTNTPPEEGFKVAKRIEDLLNKRIGVNTSTKTLAIEDAIASAGRLRVVPVFGEKGNLSKLDYQAEEPEDLISSIEDLRRVICTSIGVPYELIFGGEGSKGDLLKRYARYLRKLRAIQRSIVNGIKQIIFIHLVNKGISFNPTDIRVDFRNKLVEVDNLDSLEFMDASVSMLENVKRFIEDLLSEDNPLSGIVDKDKFAEFLDKQFSIIGLNGVIKKKEE